MAPEAALRLVGRFPKPRKTIAGTKATRERRMQVAISRAAHLLAKSWNLKRYKRDGVPGLFFDRRELLAGQKRNSIKVVEP